MVNLNLIVPFSLVGATAVVVGGIYFFYDSPQKQTKTLFKDKFKSALLSTFDNKDDALWNSKWDVLKGLNKVKNSKLSQALKDHNTKFIDDVIRGLMKRGCQEICDSEFEGEDSESYSDFKNVCSRNSLKTQFNSLSGSKKWNESKQTTDWAAAKSAYDGDSSLLIPKEGGSGNVEKNSGSKAEDFMTWCPKQENIPYINDQDEAYKKVEKLCLK